MKKLFALMLALMLALAGVSAAGAEDAAAADAAVQPSYGSGTISLEVKLNKDAVIAMAGGAGNEQAAKMIGSIIDLVNDLQLVMTSDGVDAEAFLNLKEKPIVGMAVLRDTDKMFILSDLFQNYILKVDQQNMAGVMPQISIDPEQAAAMAAPVAKFQSELTAKIGLPEAVEESYYGTPFTVKTPINMTAKEGALMLLGIVKELASQEAFTSMIKQLSAMGLKVELNPEQIDKTIEEITNKDDKDLPVLNAAIYGNPDDDSLVVVDVSKEGSEYNVTTISGKVAGNDVVEVLAGEKLHLLAQAASDGSASLSLTAAPQEGMLLNIEGTFLSAEGGFTGGLTVSVNDVELGSLLISGIKDGILSGEFTTEGKTELNVADMQDQTNEAAKGFMTDVMTGVMTLMSRIVAVNPDFATILQSMIPQPVAQPQQ